MKRRPHSRTVPIGSTGAGTREVVAAPAANQMIVVTAYVCVMDGGGTFKWQSAATDISDAIPAEDKGGVATSGSIDDALLICGMGEALNIVTTVGGAKGHVTYHIEP